MQWIKNKIKESQEKKRTIKEILMIYGLLGVLGIQNLFFLKELGYTSNGLFLQQIKPKEKETCIELKLMHKWFLTLTGIEWEDSLQVIMDLMPYRKQLYLQQVASNEVKGYFEQDENTYLEEMPMSEYIPQTPTVTSLQDYAAFQDTEYVYTHYYTAPGKMEFGLDMLEEWDFYDLVTKPISVEPTVSGPKILIFHTHSREEYIGGLTVVDIADALAETLEQQYGIEVLHVKDSFYESTNTSNRPTGGEYERMEPTITRILKENPSISVVIDLHRDGVNEEVHLVTDIEGKKAARIMFVNGLCLNRNIAGQIEKKEDLPNPYIGENLALSLQSMVYMNQLYPGLSRKIYLNEWRYSTHMKPYSLLMEWGAQTNTSEEALNSVGPVAEILAKVLQKD